jgi:hypothetical protein
MTTDEYRELCAEAQAIALDGYHYIRGTLPETGREVLLDYNELEKTYLVVETPLDTLEMANPNNFIWSVSRWSGDWKAVVSVDEALNLDDALVAADLLPKPRKDRFGDGFSDEHLGWFKLAMADVADAAEPSKIELVACETGMYAQLFEDGFHVALNGTSQYDDEGIHFRKAAPDGESHWRVGCLDAKRGFVHPSNDLWYVERVDNETGRRIGISNLSLDECMRYEAIPTPSPDQNDPVAWFMSWDKFDVAEDKSVAPGI